MTTTKKGTTVHTSKIQPGELVTMEFSFYNVTYIRGFTSMLTVVCKKTRMLWVLPTAHKREPVHIIRFILTSLMNKQHPCKMLRVDKDSALENSKYVTYLLVDEFRISMETSGGDISWINRKNERHNRSINYMVSKALLDSDQHENKWCCAAEISAEVHRRRMYSALENISPHFAWYVRNPRIHELRAFGCDIYPIKYSPKKLDNRTQEGSITSYTKSRATMKWWTHTKRDSNNVHLQNFMSTTITLAKFGHQALNLCLAQIIPPFQH